jgi:hypothetical protein
VQQGDVLRVRIVVADRHMERQMPQPLLNRIVNARDREPRSSPMRRAVTRLGSPGHLGAWNFTSVSRQSSPRPWARHLRLEYVGRVRPCVRVRTLAADLGNEDLRLVARQGRAAVMGGCLDRRR